MGVELRLSHPDLLGICMASAWPGLWPSTRLGGGGSCMGCKLVGLVMEYVSGGCKCCCRLMTSDIAMFASCAFADHPWIC